MKYKGKRITEPNTEIIVIPRSGSEDIVFKAQAVMSSDDFTELFPKPSPPVRLLKGGDQELAYDDPNFTQELQTWIKAKSEWTYIKSLSATPDLEWDTVDMEKPETFVNWREELKEAYFSEIEIIRIINGVHAACGLNQDRIDEATQSFLAGLREAQSQQSSQNGEPSDTQSGEPASE